MKLRRYEEKCYYYPYDLNFFEETEEFIYVTDIDVVNNSVDISDIICENDY